MSYVGRSCHPPSTAPGTLDDTGGGAIEIRLVDYSTTDYSELVLTIIATIFIPLTFIVGVYGMNFDTRASPWSMPELGWYYGYPLIWALMTGVSAALLWLFRRRNWL